MIYSLILVLIGAFVIVTDLLLLHKIKDRNRVNCVNYHPICKCYIDEDELKDDDK